LGDQTEKKEMVGHVAHMGRVEVCLYKILVGKAERKRPLGRPRRKWEDNIKMHLHESELGVLTGSSWLRIGTDGWNL
jgi:hypothetical protein